MLDCPDGAEPADQQKSAASILVVDDDAFNLKLFAAILESQGYRVRLAMDAERGLDLVRQEHPSLIIMDIQLPGMSGLDATRRLKSDDRTRAIPIIVATAFLIDKEDVRASGCDHFLTKPFATADLLRAVEILIAEPTEWKSSHQHH